jgi:hypothetical protein
MDINQNLINMTHAQIKQSLLKGFIISDPGDEVESIYDQRIKVRSTYTPKDRPSFNQWAIYIRKQLN